MKNLVLSSMVAALAFQATACVIVDDDDDGPPDGNRVAVTWNYKVNGVTQQGCPAGANSVALLIKDQTSGITDEFKYDCGDKVLIEYVPDGTYQIWVELLSGGNTYAQSVSLLDTLTAEDTDITVDIHEDKGYFFFAWALKGATSNQNLTCSQVPDLRKISLLATPVGTAQMIDSLNDCAPGLGFSQAMNTGLYTLTVEAVNSNNDALGSAGVATNREVKDRNQFTDLGTVVIPIDRQ